MSALMPHIESAARFIVAIMLNSLWEDTILVFAVWLLLRTLRQTNASTRYFSWLVTMIAAVLLPIVTTIPQTTFLSTGSAQAAATSTRADTKAAPPVVLRRAAAKSLAPAQAAQESRFRAPERLRLQFPSWVATVLFVAWVLMALLIGIRLGIDLYSLERLKRDSLPLPVEFRDQMEKWVQAAYGNDRDVRICVSDRIEVPVAVGLFDSMILLPKHLLDELSAGELDRISLHELAHLHRGDDWTNSVQRFAQTLLFFNPAVRFIGSHLDLEREVACDDWVLSLTGDVRPYATCLTRMAELTTWPHRPLAAPGVFVTRKGISIRIERLLNKHRNARVKISYAVPALVATALVAFFVLANVVTPVIAYTTESAATTVATVKQSVIMVTQFKTKQVETPQPPSIVVHPLASVAPLPKVVAQPKVAGHPKAAAHPASLSGLPKVAPLPPLARVRPFHAPRGPHTFAESIDIPEINVDVPGQNINVHVPPVHVHVPATHVDLGDQIDSETAPRASSSGFSCTGCNFKGVDWSGKDMSGRSYVGADFANANLEGTNFSHARLSGVDFSRANLHNANFSGAEMSGCELRGANLLGARFEGARISGCGGVNARSMDQSQLRVWLTQCSGCDFAHADFHGMDLRGIRSSGMDFTHANFSGADFSNAEFSGVDFSGANLSGARLHGTRFTGCDFSHTDLRGVDLSEASMTGSDLSSAIMR